MSLLSDVSDNNYMQYDGAMDFAPRVANTSNTNKPAGVIVMILAALLVVAIFVTLIVLLIAQPGYQPPTPVPVVPEILSSLPRLVQE